jgi:hypothetical protein
MSLKLPPIDSPVRQLFDVAFIADACSPANRSKLPTFREALRNGREFLARAPSAKAVNMLALRADGAVWLVKVTPRAWSRAWSFGQP